MSHQEIVQALAVRFGFETVDVNEAPNQIRIIGRVVQAHTRNWLIGVHHLLATAEATPWNLDISRQYFLRDGSLVYAWRMIFQHAEVATHIPQIVSAIAGAPRARFEVEEVAISQGPRTMMNERGKGAASAGTPPLLIRQRMGGM